MDNYQTLLISLHLFTSKIAQPNAMCDARVICGHTCRIIVRSSYDLDTCLIQLLLLQLFDFRAYVNQKMFAANNIEKAVHLCTLSGTIGIFHHRKYFQ